MSPICWGGASVARRPATLTPAQAKTCGVPVTSKEVSNASALFSCTTAAPIPLENPGLISIPIGFLFAAPRRVSSQEQRRGEVRGARGPVPDRRGRPLTTSKRTDRPARELLPTSE